MDPIGSNPQSIQSILQNIRQLRSQFDDAPAQGMRIESSQDQGNNFANTFQNAIQNVSDQQTQSANLKQAFEMGDPGVSLEQVTLASQQASIGFEAMLQVRNKIVDAYKEIMNMPV